MSIPDGVKDGDIVKITGKAGLADQPVLGGNKERYIYDYIAKVKYRKQGVSVTMLRNKFFPCKIPLPFEKVIINAVIMGR